MGKAVDLSPRKPEQNGILLKYTNKYQTAVAEDLNISQLVVSKIKHSFETAGTSWPNRRKKKGGRKRILTLQNERVLLRCKEDGITNPLSN